MTKRIHNFSAGPATLPLSILEKAQQEFLNYNNEGMSIMEMSHRSKTFESVLTKAKEGISSILSVPNTHEVLFLQGGASLQFSMVPMNLKQTGKPVQLINTGSWTKKALKEIKKECECNIIGTSEDKNFSYIPQLDSSTLSQDAAFTYLCSNNTIFGTQFKTFPTVTGSPLVADMSSDILSRKCDVSQFGLIFAGAQKNIGPSGVTIIIIRKDLAERAAESLPSMLQYRSFIDSNSLYNTIPTFGVYMISLMTEWIQNQGGLEVVERNNQDKAALLYDAIESSSMYQCPVNEQDRSLMNVVFRVNNNEELEKLFVKESKEAGLDGLKGHRSVGGLRASIYNAHPVEGVKALVDFMHSFEKKYETVGSVTATEA